jgi:hypothetical protein
MVRLRSPQVWRSPRSRIAGRFFLPAAQQPADFGHHLGGVLVLALVEPAPTHDQAQIEADSIQMVIGLAEQALPVGPRLLLAALMVS